MSQLAPGRNLVLVGLMGSGKSTVGRLVADRLGRELRDTDALVEQEQQDSVAAIFATAGERAFRALEARAVRSVAVLRGQVIAVGGGALEDPANVTHLRATGDLVLLTAPAEVLAARAAQQPGRRPLLQAPERGAEEVLRRLWARRQAVYRAAAATVVETTGRTAAEVADAVLAWAASRPGLLSSDELAELQR